MGGTHLPGKRRRSTRTRAETRVTPGPAPPPSSSSTARASLDSNVVLPSLFSLRMGDLLGFNAAARPFSAAPSFKEEVDLVDSGGGRCVVATWVVPPSHHFRWYTTGGAPVGGEQLGKGCRGVRVLLEGYCASKCTKTQLPTSLKPNEQPLEASRPKHLSLGGFHTPTELATGCSRPSCRYSYLYRCTIRLYWFTTVSSSVVRASFFHVPDLGTAARAGANCQVGTVRVVRKYGCRDPYCPQVSTRWLHACMVRMVLGGTRMRPCAWAHRGELALSHRRRPNEAR